MFTLKVYLKFYFIILKPDKFSKIYFFYFLCSRLHTVNSIIFHTSSYAINQAYKQTSQNPITQNTPTHACSVLVLSRDFLGNLIPKLNIKPHLVVMFLHDYGLSPNPQSLGFHIPILHIKPSSGDGYPNPSSLGIRIPKL